jgi:hypothetical protein
MMFVHENFYYEIRTIYSMCKYKSKCFDVVSLDALTKYHQVSFCSFFFLFMANAELGPFWLSMS